MSEQGPTTEIRFRLASHVDGAVVRIFTQDATPLFEALADSYMLAHPGTYIANIVAPNGRPVGAPTKFDVIAGVDSLEVQIPSTANAGASKFAPNIDVPGLPSILRVAMADLHRYLIRPFQTVRTYGDFLIIPNGRSERHAIVPRDYDSRGHVYTPSHDWISVGAPARVAARFRLRHASTRALQEALLHRQELLAQTIAHDILHMGYAQDSPLTIALSLLVLLRNDQAPDFAEEFETQGGMPAEAPPDLALLATELLAIQGKHEQAREQFLNLLPQLTTPWLQGTLRVVAERLSFYVHSGPATRTQKKSDELEDPPLVTFARRYQNLLAASDPEAVFCIFETPAGSAEGFANLITGVQQPSMQTQ